VSNSTIRGKLGEGHGLVDSIIDQHYAARQRGEPTGEVVAYCVLKPVGSSEGDTAKGTHHTVVYEITRFEPVLDPGPASQVRFAMHAAYKARTSPNSRQLPLAMPGMDEEEKRVATIDSINDRASELGWTTQDITDQWHRHFGIGAGEEHSWGDRGVPAEWLSSPQTWLFEFLLALEEIPDPKPVDEGPAEPSDENGVDAAGDAESDADGPADDPGPDAGTAESAALSDLPAADETEMQPVE
jgi:hypothetical protein